ncbi:MAG: hypothetical protein Q8P60_12455 [Pseudorhodobacter sp.]|nr:hypothetical protein [Pseudorhodobacter sp.]
MLHLKSGDTIIRSVNPGGQFLLPGGSVVSPAYAGWANEDGYTLAEAPPRPAPAPPSLDEVKASARAAMLAWINDFTAIFTVDTPADERLSWDAKEAAAAAQIAGNADPRQVALLADEATITGETVDNLALLILANADLYRAVIARVSGLRRTTRVAINAAESPEAVQAVLDAAKARALALAASLGVTV